MGHVTMQYGIVGIFVDSLCILRRLIRIYSGNWKMWKLASLVFVKPCRTGEKKKIKLIFYLTINFTDHKITGIQYI